MKEARSLPPQTQLGAARKESGCPSSDFARCPRAQAPFLIIWAATMQSSDPDQVGLIAHSPAAITYFQPLHDPPHMVAHHKPLSPLFVS